MKLGGVYTELYNTQFKKVDEDGLVRGAADAEPDETAARSDESAVQSDESAAQEFSANADLPL